jgi:hypothetical protein
MSHLIPIGQLLLPPASGLPKFYCTSTPIGPPFLPRLTAGGG